MSLTSMPVNERTNRPQAHALKRCGLDPVDFSGYPETILLNLCMSKVHQPLEWKIRIARKYNASGGLNHFEAPHHSLC